jgi:hypothetical protein
MAPISISIIRHAEKPGEAWPGPGLTVAGVADDRSLVVRGWQRTGAWAALFGSLGEGAHPAPDVIYAADPTRILDKSTSPTARAYETVSPLADKLGQSVVTKWAVGQEVDLAAEIIRRDGTILICWEHKKIVSDLLPAFLGPKAKLPREWPPERFDLVLRLDRIEPVPRGVVLPWQLRQLFPKLLSGDSDEPLPA